MDMKNRSRKLRVGVLRGGPSSQYESSLKTGKHVIDALRQNKNYTVQDIFIDRNGVWHTDGMSRTVDRIFPHIDVAVNSLHGAYGEDGRVQQILESHKIPYTGSTVFGSAAAMNKPLAKKFFKMHGLLTPEHVIIKKEDHTPSLLKKIFTKYPHLKLVKPSASGSSLGVAAFKTMDEFEKAVAQAFDHSDSVLVEEYIKGREASCGVIDGSTGNNIFALHPLEVRDQTADTVTALSPVEIQKIQQAAIDSHKLLGLRHYSESDFILNRFGVYILETNTLPELHTEATFSKSLHAADISFTEFLDHVIDLALENR